MGLYPSVDIFLLKHILACASGQCAWILIHTNHLAFPYLHYFLALAHSLTLSHASAFEFTSSLLPYISHRHTGWP